MYRKLLITLAAGIAVLAFSESTRPRAQLFQPAPQPATPPATAQVPLHLPPVMYDHPFKGKITTETVTPEQLRARCFNATLLSLGCSFPSSNSCHIILVDEERINAGGWTKELLLRHERAHCNGWTQDHPGKRPL